MTEEFNLAHKITNAKWLFGSRIFLEHGKPCFEVYYMNHDSSDMYRERFGYDGTQWKSELRGTYDPFPLARKKK
jgi:hypothetical protein